MLFNVNGRLLKIKMGEFIDQKIAEADKAQIENHPNNTTLAWTKEQNITVMSCDEEGKITWELVEAVTRHPPMNKDGSNILLKVTTHSGREVIATKAKSFLKRLKV